jgi:putative ABC transport system permease protein
MNSFLEIGPLLRSMRHHKGAFSLLVLEVALGFVMLTHTLVSARYYYRLHVYDTGMREDQLVIARRRFLHPRDVVAARAAQRADLAALARAGVTAAGVDGPPLPNNPLLPWRLERPGSPQQHPTWPVRATPDIVAALGLEVIVGTGLDGVSATPPADGATPVLLTSTAAERLFGTYTGAVGQLVQGSDLGRGRVAGIVRDFAFLGNWVPDPSSIVLVPAEPATEHELIYVLHARSAGARPALVDAAARALGGTADADAAVVVEGVHRETTRFAQLSGGAVIILIWTGFLVVAVALAGSLALASFSVAERTRQIGVRRALGARRSEIVSYFLLENLILTAFGLALGLGLAIGLNNVLRRIMVDLRLTSFEVLISMLVFHLTGMLSALVPARRAALIPPWAATRTL